MQDHIAVLTPQTMSSIAPRPTTSLAAHVKALWRFLESRPGDRFCTRCLATAIGATGRIDRVVLELEGRGAERRHDRCSACNKERLLCGLGRKPAPPERGAIVTSLIVGRPTCLPCIAAKSGLALDRAEAVLETVATALILCRQTARCVACGESHLVHSIGRAAS
jgi:hypothetical protein